LYTWRYLIRSGLSPILIITASAVRCTLSISFAYWVSFRYRTARKENREEKDSDQRDCGAKGPAAQMFLIETTRYD